ncbi:hypothetical protein GLOTRDRAFT_138372 [Gloeophyllum trabeum ATCC 11539]|uniref:Small ribosomal subunit protein mS29 n=1 Tax=Gloeophyllum trabeum (strain ATCC 11539 / FP-39264 / Madison 617) TaxID=670483 RepID=S7QBI5_GLOTA|nr:uncharacterized protein GLOTRDRAFT_138372 [Gloeophyllum trabeum ATCC 11539]EPQ56717.1 hypothetical protein GLOTRDRAFT_138372 [Gloeophyllum trabeum ATCC 11539]
MSAPSSLSVLRQAQCVLHRAVPGPSNVLQATVQKRHYAAKGQQQKVSQKKSQSFKGNKNFKVKASAPKKNSGGAGAFRPLSASQLQKPIFQTGRADEVDLRSFVPELTTPSHVGNAVAFTGPDNDPMRIFGLPTNILLEFRIASKPLSVIRDITVSTIDKLQAAAELPSSQTRLVMTGSRGCGKSFLLLQAVEYAVRSGWMVLYIPRAISLVNSTTTYTYDLRTQTYLQPEFAFQTLQRFRTVNAEKLQHLHTSQDIPLDRRSSLPAGSGLVDLIEIGTRDVYLAPTVLSALMEELGKQTRYPMLLAIDDFQALYCKTAYRDPQFASIKPWHLSMPRLLLDYASGRKSFARGAVLGALSTADTTYRTPLELRKALGLPDEQPTSPYVKMNETKMEYAKGLQALPVPEKLQLDEAAAVFEVWAKDKAVTQAAPKDELFMAEYSAAAGNARNFVQGILGTFTL